MSYSWKAPEFRTVSRKVPGVHLQRTSKLLVQRTPRGDTQSADEFLEVDGAILVLIEYVEYIVREFAGVTEREKLFVYPAELVLVKLARGTILEEALIPVAQSSSDGARRPRVDRFTIAEVRVYQLRWR